MVYPARTYRIYCNIMIKQAHLKIAMSNWQGGKENAYLDNESAISSFWYYNQRLNFFKQAKNIQRKCPYTYYYRTNSNYI